MQPVGTATYWIFYLGRQCRRIEWMRYYGHLQGIQAKLELSIIVVAFANYFTSILIYFQRAHGNGMQINNTFQHRHQEACLLLTSRIQIPKPWAFKECSICPWLLGAQSIPVTSHHHRGWTKSTPLRARRCGPSRSGAYPMAGPQWGSITARFHLKLTFNEWTICHATAQQWHGRQSQTRSHANDISLPTNLPWRWWYVAPIVHQSQRRPTWSQKPCRLRPRPLSVAIEAVDCITMPGWDLIQERRERLANLFDLSCSRPIFFSFPRVRCSVKIPFLPGFVDRGFFQCFSCVLLAGSRAA